MENEGLFADRAEAGRELARKLEHLRGTNAVVLGLPRGGVPVAFEVARALDVPLDVCVVRKVGAPIQQELAIGAVAEGGVVFVDQAMAVATGTSEEDLARITKEKRAEVEERVQAFRQGSPAIDIRDKTVIVVDDGIATGATTRAALSTLRQRGAKCIVLAVPVGAASTLRKLAGLADEIVCPNPKEEFFAVGLWYADFTTTTDEDVIDLLTRARQQRPERRRSERVPRTIDEDVQIPIAGASLEGRLSIPANAVAMVLFVDGSGGSRHSPRNRFVASELHRKGIATLLFDLLTGEEERIDAETGHLRFDIQLLARRLVEVTDWIRRQPASRASPIGYFGASTGAAAALVAAAVRPAVVRAVVSRGGRPDLARPALGEMHAPTLLLVGANDPEVLRLNRATLVQIDADKELESIPGATHRFEEPGTLEHVARSAASWFARYLAEDVSSKTA